MLLDVLTGAGWLTAEQVALKPSFLAHYEGRDQAYVERRIRAIANRTDGAVISYPGSPGYRLTLEATIEEIQAATAALRHQAGEMSKRALQIDRVYHGKKRP